METLNGCVAVVTGGGNGIGAAMCMAFAKEGMHVAVLDVEEEKAKEVSAAVIESGCNSLAAAVDVRNPDAVDAVAERVFAELGGCQVLCNNAGVLVVGATYERSDPDWRWVLDVNVRGVANGIRAFVPRMLAAGSEGHIVNTASSNGLFALPRNGLYTASKFAVLGMTEALRMELAEHGIGVSALCPGNVRTGILHSDRNRPGDLGVSTVTREDVMVLAGAGDDANRGMVDPEQVAGLVIEAIRGNCPYVITHPGSRETVAQRCETILAAYDDARARHPELP